MSQIIKEIPKTYLSELGESSVKLAFESDQPIAQKTKDLDRNPNTLYTWINKHLKPNTANEQKLSEKPKIKVIKLP